MEKWEFGCEFGEFGVNAVNDIGDGLAVRVDDAILLRGKMPSAESKANNEGSEFHVGRL